MLHHLGAFFKWAVIQFTETRHDMTSFENKVTSCSTFYRSIFRLYGTPDEPYVTYVFHGMSIFIVFNFNTA